MTHYRSNLRDLEFNLFEVLDVGDHYGSGPFAAVDADQARLLLDELDRFARSDAWAGSFSAADREPLHLSPEGDVTIPDALDASLDALYDAGWHLLPIPERLGGLSAPPTLRWAGTELLSGGHATASLWPIGALMAGVIDRIGTDGQRDRIALPMVERRWGGTMMLTEPDAGSDVGAGSTRATFVAPNGPEDLGSVHHLTGVKRFITSADAQTHENTVHLVLARPEGAAPGTKGLSLFLVPKFHLQPDGSLGARNGVRVTKLEHKLGIRGSATCEVTLGLDGQPCVGYLAGDVHDGIRQMFQVIEYARMMVGTKAMATLSTGYLNALDYARIRQQGADLTRMADKTAPRVPIVQHPDVRRMLMEQKAHAEGMRALVLYAGWTQDMAVVHTDDAEERARWIAREDLLLPLVKGYCSEKAFELLALSLQTFGGSGFTEDYPVEQYLRDAKIDTLYEGTTAIQALDLLFRKIVRDQGATLVWFADQVRELTKAGAGDDAFAVERERLAAALEDAQAHLGVMLTHAVASMDEARRAELYKAGLNTTEFLFSLAEVLIGWLLLRHAEVARAALDRIEAEGAARPGRDVVAERDFYAGRIASARWFCTTVLPRVALRRRKAEEEDGWLMDLPVGAF